MIAGTGTPLRQFIYSEDLAILILWSIENYSEIEPIILSVPESEEKSINFVATCIAKKFNYENLIFDKEKPDGQFKKTANNSKLLARIQNFDFTPIEEGISKTVEWFEANYKYSRR